MLRVARLYFGLDEQRKLLALQVLGKSCDLLIWSEEKDAENGFNFQGKYQLWRASGDLTASRGVYYKERPAGSYRDETWPSIFKVT